MAKQIPNVFSSYELTDKEALEGSIFTTLQLQVLQNKLAEVATEKLNLEFDTTNQLSFIQQEAYKKGELELLTYLIDTSTVSADMLKNPIQQ